MSGKMRFEGIFAPLVVPLTEGGAIDQTALRRLVDWLIDRGVHGLFANGSTGEFVRFGGEERRRIVHIVCDQAAGRVPVIAGASEANVGEIVSAAADYAAMGACAVALTPPYYYRVGQETIRAYFEEIARRVAIDVVLYNIPAFASSMEADTVVALARQPRIVAIKDSSGDLPLLMEMIARIRPSRADFRFLCGSDATLAPALLMGADGGVNSTANVAPELLRRLYDAARGDDVAEARRQQAMLRHLLALLSSLEFPENFRAGAEARGLSVGAGRQPLSSAQQAQRGELVAAVRALLPQLGIVQ